MQDNVTFDEFNASCLVGGLYLIYEFVDIFIRTILACLNFLFLFLWMSGVVVSDKTIPVCIFMPTKLKLKLAKIDANNNFVINKQLLTDSSDFASAFFKCFV